VPQNCILLAAVVVLEVQVNLAQLTTKVVTAGLALRLVCAVTQNIMVVAVVEEFAKAIVVQVVKAVVVIVALEMQKATMV
jgi:hypothetical protein